MKTMLQFHHKACGIAWRKTSQVIAALSSLALVLASDGVAEAQFVVEQKILADDARSLASFGRSVGINGSRAIVGSPAADFLGPTGSGAAYLFDLVTPSRSAEAGLSSELRSITMAW